MGSLSSRQALLNPEFIDDGEDALYITFDDGDTGKYVRERTCRYEPEEFDFPIDEDGNEVDGVYEPSEDCAAFVCSECGGSMLYGYDMGWFDDKPPYKPYFGFCPYCGSRVEWGEPIEPRDKPYNLFSLYEAVFQRTPRDGFVIEDDEVEELIDALIDICNAPGHDHIARVRSGKSDGEIDRDALLKLADEFDAMAEAGIAAVLYRGDLFGCADRIREAVGA